MELKPEDLVITTYRPAHQGAWSQVPVSGVRIVHLPTGAIAMCDTSRSAFKNRQEAMRLLEIKVTDIEESNLMAGTKEPSEHAKVQRLKNALQKLMDEYIRGGESGDWGSWDPHEQDHVIQAKAVLAQCPVLELEPTSDELALKRAGEIFGFYPHKQDEKTKSQYLEFFRWAQEQTKE